MLKRYLVVVSALAFTIGACNNNTRKDSEKMADQQNEQKADSSKAMQTIDDDSKFVVKATSGVTMETELGRFAEKNAATPGVRTFGETMLKDHSKDKEKLIKLAAAKNITVPEQAGANFKKHIDEITSKKGIEFDKAYISFMVGDHKDDISEFEKETKDGKDADIKSFALQGLPVLAHHLAMAKSLNEKLK